MDDRTKALYASVADEAREGLEVPKTSLSEVPHRRKPLPNAGNSADGRRRVPHVRNFSRKTEHFELENGHLADENNAYNLYDMAANLPGDPWKAPELATSTRPSKEKGHMVASTNNRHAIVIGPRPEQDNQEGEEGEDLRSHGGRASMRKRAGSPTRPEKNKPLPDLPPTTSTSTESGLRMRSRAEQKEKRLDKTSDTTVATRYSPAVVHETVREDVHEVEHQQIVRDIHQSHVYHRILPVHEIEVLPPVHYVADEGQVRQVRGDEIPQTWTPGLQAKMEAALKDVLPKDSSRTGPRQFTARGFPGQEGNSKKSMGKNGRIHSEKWWVHPPQLESRPPGDTEARHISINN